jgi:hypothetical protein
LCCSLLCIVSSVSLCSSSNATDLFFSLLPCSGQAYVAAFLAKSGKALAEEAAAKQQQDGTAAAAGEASAGDADAAAGKGSGVDHLHEVGTFAQVHTILAGDSADSAQLLLLGHRRLKREAVVSGWLAGWLQH